MESFAKFKTEQIPYNPTGAWIDKKFIIGRLINSGNFGKVYKVVRFDNLEEPLVIKICSDANSFKEAKITQKILSITSKKII